MVKVRMAPLEVKVIVKLKSPELQPVADESQMENLNFYFPFKLKNESELSHKYLLRQ